MSEDASFLNRITSVVPSERQTDFGNTEYYNFIHFGLNTFTGKEWGSGKVPTSAFSLKIINTEKWVTDLKATGSRGIIITAKHHDGFCLYPSKYTDYTIANTVYKNGKGDIVGELAENCKKHNMKFGIYLSPWDRHEKTYGTESYNDFFINQLTELCTNYGDIFCFWFDGACGEGETEKRQEYDWERYYSVIRLLQPNACISVCGPDIRWIGNERGTARKSEFSVVPVSYKSQVNIAEQSQQKEGASVMMQKAPATNNNIGCRETLIGEDLCWYPSEMNIPITYFGWFYNPVFKLLFTRTKHNLLKCYYNSVGHNATLLINVPPNKKGELPKKFIGRLISLNSAIKEQFAKEIEFKYSNTDCSYVATFEKQTVSAVVLCEDLTKSQRVEKFAILADGKKIYDGTTIGRKQICLFKSISCCEIKIVVKESRGYPHICNIKIYTK